MKKEIAATGFTSIPNAFIKSDKYDAVEKMVLIAIASYCPAFPSYEHLQKILNIGREKLWKTLRKLEENSLVKRYRYGTQGVLYVPFWEDRTKLSADARLLKFTDLQEKSHNGTSSVAEPVIPKPVRQPNYPSSVAELVPVRQPNSNKNKEKENLKRISNEIFTNGNQEDYNNVVLLPKRLSGIIDFSQFSECPF